MSQSTNNIDEKNIDKNVKKDHSTRNLIIFLLIFTILCVGITAVLIYNQKKNSVEEKISSGEAVIDETGKIIENDDVEGVSSLNKTYQKNNLKVSEVVYKQNNTTNGNTVSYIQIEGLNDKELENKINERLKQEVLNKYKENEQNQYYLLSETCTANFANVLSVKISEVWYGSNDYKNSNLGINIDLTTGNDISFNELFTYNAGIKNILSKSAYDSLAESYTSGDGSELDDTPVYGATEDELEFYYESSEEKESREENYAQIEDDVFKLMSKFNTGANLNYSFSPRCIYVYESDYTVEIEMKKYYSQIAIYNRFNNVSDVFDENYQSSDILKNDTIPVFISYSDDNTSMDIVNGSSPIFIKYMNVKKESDDMVYYINYMPIDSTIDINENIEEINVIKNKIKSEIEQYANIHDGNKRFIQFSINYNDDSSYGSVEYGYEKEVYCVPESNDFIPTTIEYFQDGGYKLYFYLKYASSDAENIWKDCGISYKDISYEDIKYEYNKKTNKWTEKNYNDINEENENANNNNSSTSQIAKTIVIDAGHQEKGNSEKEPIGPGATETKAKVAGGATGVTTGQTEYSLNLKVATKLKTRLEEEGYTVIMTRTTNDVDISNSERAQIANNANADAFIRIHANSDDSSSAKGVLTMCQTSSNVYNGNLADESYSLSKKIVDCVASKTGAQNRGVTRTDTMSGINWCQVPSTIIEMGFLSNSEEDTLLAEDDYQNKIVDGIVEGLEQYFS